MLRRWRSKREYTPGAPLYARQAMKLRGISIQYGELIPAEILTPKKHRQLWQIRRADHVQPKRKTSADMVAAPQLAVDEPVAPTATAADPDAMTLEQLEALTVPDSPAPAIQAPIGVNMRGPAATTAGPTRTATAQGKRATRR